MVYNHIGDLIRSTERESKKLLPKVSGHLEKVYTYLIEQEFTNYKSFGRSLVGVM